MSTLVSNTVNIKALKLPVLTTSQRNSISKTSGMVIYNSSENQPQVWDGSEWLGL